MKRHKTLFNLYAFDRLRTKNTNPPTLELRNCTFKYFVNKLDSLVQIENNNLGFIGSVPANAQAADDRILTYLGEDRGAKITMDNVHMRSSSFCKGVVYYNQFQSVTYEQAPTLLNFTANFRGDSAVDYSDKASANHIIIKNSTFKNMGLQQVH